MAGLDVDKLFTQRKFIVGGLSLVVYRRVDWTGRPQPLSAFAHFLFLSRKIYNNNTIFFDDEPLARVPLSIAFRYFFIFLGGEGVGNRLSRSFHRILNWPCGGDGFFERFNRDTHNSWTDWGCPSNCIKTFQLVALLVNLGPNKSLIKLPSPLLLLVRSSPPFHFVHNRMGLMGKTSVCACVCEIDEMNNSEPVLKGEVEVNKSIDAEFVRPCGISLSRSAKSHHLVVHISLFLFFSFVQTYSYTYTGSKKKFDYPHRYRTFSQRSLSPVKTHSFSNEIIDKDFYFLIFKSITNCNCCSLSLDL